MPENKRHPKKVSPAPTASREAAVPVHGRPRRGRPVDPAAAQLRRQKLVDAALTVIARDGLAATTTRAIAAESGLNLATLHYNFPGKYAVLIAVLEGIQQRVEVVLVDAMAGARTLRQAVRNVMEAYWAHVVETPGFQRAQFEITMHALAQPDGAQFAQQQYESYISGVEAVFSPLAPVGFDLRHFAGVCVAAVDGLIMQFLVTQDRVRCANQLELSIRGLETLCPE